MSKARSVFLTGATGFLGSHLCYALLEEGHRVTALARPARSESARDRVVAALERVPDTPEAARPLLGLLEIVEGDIAKPRLGIDGAGYEQLCRRIDETWHSAASLSFMEEDRGSIFRMNVDGARHVLDLVSRTRTRRLHHVSTAYVAGKREGAALENEADIGQEFRNPYEESKCRAEVMIGSEQKEGRVVASIYRPSIVIGDSRTGRATHFHGVYAFMRGLWAVVERLRRKAPGAEMVDLPLRVRGSESATLNFVPIDYVTQAMMTISKQPSAAGRVFHLANPSPTENRLWLGTVCQQLRVRGLRLVGGPSFAREPMTRLEALFERQMAFYFQYLNGEPRFDCRGAVEALAETPIRCPSVTPEFARRMTGWYIDMLNRNSGTGHASK